jgi:hypothetical protein
MEKRPLIAIHHRAGSFSDKWLEFCEKFGIGYKLVDCYGTDILSQLQGCQGLLWHWSQSDVKAANFARQLTYALEEFGVSVFPNRKTAWHFDDKLGQKYLLEALGLKSVATYVFYDRQAALAWAGKAVYPIVFKLTRGAGSMNVLLMSNYRQARKAINKSFGGGWRDQYRLYALRSRVMSFRDNPSWKNFIGLGRGLIRLVVPHPAHKAPRIERNYVYLQEFIADNNHDIRVVVIGCRAFAIKRGVRKGDFRASGSGSICHDPATIPLECVRIAFDASDKIGSQCMAYDFVFKDGKPLIVEISYGFTSAGYRACPGYWDKKLSWQAGEVVPEWFMLEDFLSAL